MVTIIQARPADVPRVAPLFDLYRIFYGQPADQAAARRFLQSRLEARESIVFLALVGAEPAGFAQLYPTYSSVRLIRAWLLNDLFVHPDHRRHGVAAALMDRVIAFAGETGARRVELETATDNHPARALYERLGFVRGEGFEHYQFDLGAE